jgi:hypothetical protein
MTLDVHNLAAFQNALAVDHRCLALILQGGDLLDEALWATDFFYGEIARVANGDAPAIYKAARAFARSGLKAAHSSDACPRCLLSVTMVCASGRSDLTSTGADELQQGDGGCIGFAEEVYDAAIHDRVRDTRPSLGERSGLSRATTFIVAARSSCTPPLNNTPCRAMPPIADKKEAGVADDQYARRRDNHSRSWRGRTRAEKVPSKAVSERQSAQSLKG